MRAVFRRSALWGVFAVAAWLSWGSGSVPPLQGTVTSVTASMTGTVLDIHGRADVQTVPPACLAGAPPHPTSDPSQYPQAMWLAINPANVRAQLPVTGYRVWASPVPPGPNCPRSERTEVYNGLYVFDLTPFLGKSGAVLRAKALAFVQSTSVQPLFIPQPPLAPADAFRCDEASAGLATLWVVPPATPVNAGFNEQLVNPGSPARIPWRGATQVGSWPAKVPTQRATGSSVHTLEADITRQVVALLSALEAAGRKPTDPAGTARMVFAMGGTNDPPGIKDAPLPFSDCRGAARLTLNIEVL